LPRTPAASSLIRDPVNFPEAPFSAIDDRITGAARKRTGLARALKACAAGDVLIVWRLDRLGRSLAHLIEFLPGLAAGGVQFRSLSESIDTTTPTGKPTPTRPSVSAARYRTSRNRPPRSRAVK